MNEIERFLVSKAVYSENSLLTDKYFQLVAFKIMSLIPLFHHVHFEVHMYKCTKNQFIDIEMIFFQTDGKIQISSGVYFDVEIKNIPYEIVVIFICFYDQIYVKVF